MFNRLKQEALGSNIQQAGGDINNLTIQLSQKLHRPSAIERVISGLYDITEHQSLPFTPPDTQPYTIHDKIEHNKLSYYSRFYGELKENYPLVNHQIESATSSDPSFTLKVIEYVKGVYREVVSTNDDNPDGIIKNMAREIQKDLQDCGSNVSLEEIKAVEHVIFYVFAQCKIFDKPPPKTT